MKLSDHQVHALGVVHSIHVVIGMETLCGIRAASAVSLRNRGLLEARGVRHPEWVLTAAGRATVAELLATGRLVRDEP